MPFYKFLRTEKQHVVLWELYSKQFFKNDVTYIESFMFILMWLIFFPLNFMKFQSSQKVSRVYFIRNPLAGLEWGRYDFTSLTRKSKLSRFCNRLTVS